MACYACEDCPKNVDYGGKCTRYEYNCPFGVVENYDSEKLTLIREQVRKISEAIVKLKELDDENYLECEINSVQAEISNIEDKIDEDIEKEWKEIQNCIFNEETKEKIYHLYEEENYNAMEYANSMLPIKDEQMEEYLFRYKSEKLKDFKKDIFWESMEYLGMADYIIRKSRQE